MNGYDAQDMAAQGADGFRNGYQAGYADAVKAIEAAQPAAAQEAVAWQRRYIGPFSERAMAEWHTITKAKFVETKTGKWANLYDVRELYAAPVTAAPAELIERCKEILAWQRTGFLPGDALSAYANARWPDEHDPLQIAEKETAREAFRILSMAAAVSTPAAPADGRYGFHWSPEQFAAALERISGGALSDYEGREEDESFLRNAATLIRRMARTPAAPGIDLYPIRCALQYAAAAARENTHTEMAEGFDALIRKIDASPKGDLHADDLAVDAFAAAMKAKLADARAKGRGGWQGDEPGMQQRLSDMLRAHVEKGDPRDVANFCMFLHQRGEGISPKGGSEARDAARYRYHRDRGITFVERNDYCAYRVTKTGDAADTATDAAMQAQAGDAEVQPLCDLCRKRPEAHSDAEGIGFCEVCWGEWVESNSHGAGVSNGN